jgi:CheY-like chemotaxis protein
MIKLLLIEDDVLILRMYQKIFSFEGYYVEVASNGEEGLTKAKTMQPTLILLDMMMPKLNGLEVLDRLKADPATQKIPVVVLTNLAGTQDAETALSRGAVKYLVKSQQDPKTVSKMIKELIDAYTRDNIPSVSDYMKDVDHE